MLWVDVDYSKNVNTTVGALLSFILHGDDTELVRDMCAAFPERRTVEPPSNFKLFLPPYTTDTPDMLFAPGISSSSCHEPRFIRRSNPCEILVYTDGSCINNGYA